MSPFRPDLLRNYQYSGNLVIVCSDERFVDATLKFVHTHLHAPHFDLMAVAGGPAFLVREEQNLCDRLNLLIQVHKIQNLFLFSHQDCGFYRNSFPHLSPQELEERILAELKQAKTWRHGHPLSIRTFYTATDGTEIFFEEV